MVEIHDDLRVFTCMLGRGGGGVVLGVNSSLQPLLYTRSRYCLDCQIQVGRSLSYSLLDRYPPKIYTYI